MLVAMESPSRISAGLVKSKNEESFVSAFSITLLTLRLWKLKSRLRMKSAGGSTGLLLTPPVRPGSQRALVSFVAAPPSAPAAPRSSAGGGQGRRGADG